MPWAQVLVALICTILTVRSSPCSWVEVLSSWNQGYKAVVKLQMDETVDHWDVDVEFSESVINFEAWKGHVNKISDTHYTVSNTCYNNMVYSCQCFELPYIVRHEPMWEGNTTFKFNGEQVPACEPPSCDDSLSGVANSTSTFQPTESLTTSELTENLNVVGNMLNDLSSLGLKRYKRQSNGFTKDENELLNTLAEYTTYLKNECSTKSGSCQSKTLAAYGSKLNSVFQKVKNSGGISSGFVDAFKEKYEQLKEATKTAVDNQAEKSCKANGKPCIFPFKDDAGKEHNTCADYKGRYFWCATRVNSKGKYVSWEKCPDNGRCPLPKTTTTTTTTTTPPPTKQPQQGVSCMAGSKPCVFPFKDTDGTEYNDCADYKGRYFWCATAVNSKGTFTNWGKCTECEDPHTTPSTPEDCSCTDYINKKGYGDCQKGHPDFSNAEICYVKLPSTCSDLRESKTDPGKMASAEACKKDDGDDSCCQELDIVSTGVALEHQGARLGSYKKQAEENDGKPVYLQEGAGGNYLFYRETFGWLISRQGPQSTSEGGIMSDSEADCPTDGGMKWKIYDRATYDNIDSTFKLTCKGSDTTVTKLPTKPPGSCLANGKPCIFPFKDDDETSYNGCPQYEGRYYWCAISLKTNGVYNVWEHCPEDGSCPLLNNDDTSAPTKPSESPETTPGEKWEPGTTSFYISDGNKDYKCDISFEYITNKKTEFKSITSTCSESTEQEDNIQYVGKHNFSLISKEGAKLSCSIGAAMAMGALCQTVLKNSLHCDVKSDTTTENTCCESLIISSTGGTADHQGARLGTYKKDGEYNNKPVYKQQEGSKILFFSELPGYEWVVGSSFSSGGGLRSKPGEDPVCPSDAKEWEYYIPGTTNTWIVDSTARVDCEEGISDCRLATKSDCPTEHTFLEGGFTTIPYDSMLDSTHNVDTKCKCRDICDDRPIECKAFLFKTCSKGSEPRCILLNEDKPATTTTGRYKKHFAFCRRDMDTPSKDERTILLRALYPQNCPSDGFQPSNEFPTSDSKIYKIQKGIEVNTVENCGHKCAGMCIGFHFEISDRVQNESPTPLSVCKLIFKKTDQESGNIEDEEFPSKTWFTCEKEEESRPPKKCKEEKPETNPTPKCGPAWLKQNQGYSSFNWNSDAQRIIGGVEDPDITHWPWMASIKVTYLKNEDGGMKLSTERCGGVLVSCQHIVTALHCVLVTDEDKNGKFNRMVEQNELTIWLNSAAQGTIDVKKSQFHATKIFVLFPSRNDGGGINEADIAVIRLHREIDPAIDSNVRPILLPLRRLNTGDYVQSKLWITGWGLIGRKQETDEAGTPITDDDGQPVWEYQTTHFFRYTNRIREAEAKHCAGNFFSPVTHICYQMGPKNADCAGDSGSPGVIWEFDSVTGKKRWYLQSIVHAGVHKNCFEDNYGMHMDVEHFKNILINEAINFDMRQSTDKFSIAFDRPSAKSI